jgi:hypothetical protein
LSMSMHFVRCFDSAMFNAVLPCLFRTCHTDDRILAMYTKMFCIIYGYMSKRVRVYVSSC